MKGSDNPRLDRASSAIAAVNELHAMYERLSTRGGVVRDEIRSTTAQGSR